MEKETSTPSHLTMMLLFWQLLKLWFCPGSLPPLVPMSVFWGCPSGYSESLPLLIILPAGVSSEHPELGLEAGWRRDLPSGAQARLHRPVLSRPRLQHHDGQPVCHAELQNCEFATLSPRGSILLHDKIFKQLLFVFDKLHQIFFCIYSKAELLLFFKYEQLANF